MIDRERIVVACLIVTVGLFVWTKIDLINANHRIDHDEAKTCAIQARGLPAAHHLAASMSAINTLIQPPNPGDPRAKALPKPPPTPAYYAPALATLRAELPLYLGLTAKQPATRSCR